MMKMKKRHRRRSDRYARRATRRMTPVGRRRTKYVAAIVIGAVAVVIVALIWGNILKARSDEYHAKHPDVSWTLDEDIATPEVPSAPTGDAALMQPGGTVPRAYDTAMLSLGSASEETDYASDVLIAAGISLSEDLRALSDDVTRVHARGLTAAGLFTVRSLDESEPAMAAYRRGLELARLTECAAAGLDEILLVGLPVGDSAQDTAAATFVLDLKKAMASLEDPPIVTVILPLRAYALSSADGTWSYDRRLTPGRLLTACDSLVVDLREVSAEEVEDHLRGMQYPYVRYNLRLLINGETVIPGETTGEGEPVSAEMLAREHGFERLMVWYPAAAEDIEE